MALEESLPPTTAMLQLHSFCGHAANLTLEVRWCRVRLARAPRQARASCAAMAPTLVELQS